MRIDGSKVRGCRVVKFSACQSSEFEVRGSGFSKEIIELSN